MSEKIVASLVTSRGRIQRRSRVQKTPSYQIISSGNDVPSKNESNITEKEPVVTLTLPNGEVYTVPTLPEDPSHLSISASQETLSTLVNYRV